MSETETVVEPQEVVEPAPAPTPEPTPEEKKPVENKRSAMVRAIAERYESQQRAKELAYGERMDDEAHDRATHQEVGTTTREKEHHESAQEPTLPAQAKDPEQAPVVARSTRRAIPINGQQVELSDDEIAHLADMGGRALAYVRQQQAQPQQQPAQPTYARQPTPPVIDSANPPALDDAVARDIVQRLSYGTPEDAAAAIRQLHEHATRTALDTLSRQQQQPQTDPQMVIQAAEERVLSRIRLENNLQVIGQEYPNIFNNSRRSQLAALALHEVRSRDAMLNRQRPDIDYYREACSLVCNELGIPATTAPSSNGSKPPPTNGGSSATVATPSTTRVERKRAAPSTPSSATQVATEAPRRHPSSSDIVESYRRQRGQMPLH